MTLTKHESAAIWWDTLKKHDPTSDLSDLRFEFAKSVLAANTSADGQAPQKDTVSANEWISVTDRLPEIIEWSPGSVAGISKPVYVYLGEDEGQAVWRYRRGGRGDLTSCYWDLDEAMLTHWRPIHAAPNTDAAPSSTITIQEAWEAAGGNPGIKATKEELIAALKTLDEVCDEVDAAPASTSADARDQSIVDWIGSLKEHAGCKAATLEHLEQLYARIAANAQPVALTVEQREAIEEVICLARDEGLPGTADMLRSILAAPAQPTDPDV